MLSNQTLQNTIDGLKVITGTELAVVSDDVVLASAFEDENKIFEEHPRFNVYNGKSVYCEVIVGGGDEESIKAGKIAAFQIENLLILYKERYDKDNFAKLLLLDNLLPSDIYTRAKKLNIERNARRVVYYIETDRADANSEEIIKSMFPSKNKDFVISLDEKSLALLKELDDENDIKIEKQAAVIRDTLSAEIMSKVYVSFGTVSDDLKTAAGSYKEAKTAREICKIFDPEKTVASYKRLGIGRLIHHIPAQFCRLFISEALRGLAAEKIDEETLSTVNKLFENNLNISETARNMYIHRNTISYRLDKLQKATGLDIRSFEDAMTFKLAMMVSRQISSL